MTFVADLPKDNQHKQILDHGFVYVVDHMGSDAAIVQAARVSYGAGTKTVNEDRGLIRYLLRMGHTSPLEQVEIKFHIKLPLFVQQQLLRHRVANVNQYSGRYSEMTDEFYVPNLEHTKPQSTDNKQGRAGEFDQGTQFNIQKLIEDNTRNSYEDYQDLLGINTARELARVVLPVANYTECYWKIDLHNLFKFLKLRMDSHAQYEIRVYADAMYELIKPLFPLACEAAEDYIFQAVTLSRMECKILREALVPGFVWPTDGDAYGLSKREYKDLLSKIF